MSWRLKLFIMSHLNTIYGFRWVPQCGNWTVLIVWKKDVYCQPVN